VAYSEALFRNLPRDSAESHENASRIWNRDLPHMKKCEQLGRDFRYVSKEKS
jgi:hypothetical protein